MRFGKLCLVTLGVALAGCATVKTERIADRPVKFDYVSKKLGWRQGGVLAIYYKVFEQGDRVSLCGAYATNTRKGVGGTTFNDLALQSMSVSIDGRLLAKDLSFFKQLNYPKDHLWPEGNATCVVTEIPWETKYRSSITPKIIRGRTSFTIRN